MDITANLIEAQSLIVAGYDAKAISILEPLCTSGVVDAMQMLGSIYQTRPSGELEGRKAVTLISQAAALGSGLAAHNLATAFVTGLPGVLPDQAESQKYLRLAKSLGVELLPSKMYE